MIVDKNKLRKTLANRAFNKKCKTPLPDCIFCHKTVASTDEFDFLKSATGEKFWHTKCFEREYGHEVK